MKTTVKRTEAIESLKKQLEQIQQQAIGTISAINGKIELLQQMTNEEIEIEDGKPETNRNELS